MNVDFRCDCPITSALDIVGDKWLLVIVKLMLLEGVRTFKDFTDSREGIATNILAAKLKILEHHGLIVRADHPTNKKTKLYQLTDKGLSLTPLIVELALWSDYNLRAMHPTMDKGPTLDAMKIDREGVISQLKLSYKR